MEHTIVRNAYRMDRRKLQVWNYQREDLECLVRYSSITRVRDGLVQFTDISPDHMENVILEQIEYFQTIGTGFEWKVYGSDQPPELKDRLLKLGFEEGDPESLMVCETAGFIPNDHKAMGDIEVRRIRDVTELDELMDLQELVWSRDFAWLLPELRSMWAHADFYSAYKGNTIIGSGWINYPHGSQFAEIHGGAVLPEFRGRGVYSVLLENRMSDAHKRGIKWVAVDASRMSKPILKKKGFESIDWTCPYTWKSGSAGQELRLGKG